MRGIQADWYMRLYKKRIIPAHAGNTAKNFDDFYRSQDHPRSCGEYHDWSRQTCHHRGSSPLMRGIPTSKLATLNVPRIIPAHAGNTTKFENGKLIMEDHPRSCGEYLDIDDLPVYLQGSSPLMRGILNRETVSQYESRIIPAHAGNTTQRPVDLIIFQDHPRSCGEYQAGAQAVRRIRGSSPLMRGIHIFSAQVDDIYRIIPAHAGNTRCVQSEIHFDTDHPRSCGEYFFTFNSEKNGLRIIPAHAGNTPSRISPVRSSKDHPRSCGEYFLWLV